MKFFIYLTLLVSISARSEMIVTKSTKTVYLIPEFRLNLNLFKINEGEIFGALNVHFQIDRTKMEEEIEQAIKDFPEFKRVFTMPKTLANWEIPLIGKVELKESMEGPYYIEQRFLDYKQFNEIKNYPFSNLSFTSSNAITMDDLKESRLIPSYKCQELFLSGRNINQVAAEFQSLMTSEWMNSIKFEQTRQKVKSYLLDACFLPFEKPVKSFKELLAVEMIEAPEIQDYIIEYFENIHVIKKVEHRVPVFLEVK